MSKNTWLYIIIGVLVGCLSACDKNAHEAEQHGVSACLSFADELDVNRVKAFNGYLWIYNSTGKLVEEYTYADEKDLASQRFYLASGQYIFVSALNLQSPLAYKNQNATETLTFQVSSSTSLPEHAFYATTEVEVDGNKSQWVTLPMKRFLSELTIMITDAPSGTRLAAKVYEPAEGVYPVWKDADGRFGLPTAESLSEITIPEVTEQGGNIVTESVKLMPTPQGKSVSKMELVLTTVDGGTFVCDVEAPVMQLGGIYELNLPYHDLKPYLHVSASKITDWKEGWTIDGEILNPTN